MIYLKTGTNSIVVTLYEKSTQLQPYYTWNLLRKGTFQNTIFYSPDTSTSPYYWNRFDIILGTISVPDQGFINTNEGEYIYKIYETSLPTPDTGGGLTYTVFGLVETGICIIQGTYSTQHEYIGTMDNTINYYNNI